MIVGKAFQAGQGQVPLSATSDYGYTGFLSDSVYRKLGRVPPAVRKIWDAIFTRAYLFERMEIFDKKILSRVDAFSLFEESIAEKMHTIFMSSCEVIDIFLSLATTHSPAYYTRADFIDLVERFLVFQARHGSQPVSVMPADVPCFDQNGREWLEAAIQNGLTQLGDDCRSLAVVERVAQRLQNASTMLTLVNKEMNVVGYGLVSGQQCVDGVGYTASRVFGWFLPQTPQKSDTEKFVTESIGRFDIDPVHFSRIAQICNHFFGPSAPVSARLDIQVFLFLLAKVKDTMGLFFFLQVSQPISYERDKPAFEDVLFMMQLFCQLNDLKKIDEQVVSIVRTFHQGAVSVCSVIDMLLSIHYRVEERATDPFSKKCFFDEAFTAIECKRISAICTAIEWGQKKEEERKTFKDVINEIKLLKPMLGGGSFMLLLNSTCYQHVHSPTVLYRLFHQIKIVVGIGGRVDAFLQRFYSARISLFCLEDLLEKLKIDISESKSSEKDLSEIARGLGSLSDAEIESILADYREVYAAGQQFRGLRIEELIQKVEELRSLAQRRVLSKSESNRLLALAREALLKELGIYPYNTQMIALIGLLHHSIDLRGRIAQIKTGEGKSTIIAMLAFYHAVLGRSVDVVSSSRYLALRDEEKYRGFFSTYGITSSSLCSDSPSKTDFAGQITFSTNFDVEFAVMHDYFKKQPMRTVNWRGDGMQRPFEVVIVDEVDNLFFDSAMNSARISIPDDQPQHPIYEPIFRYVEQHQRLVEDFISGDRESLELREGIGKALRDVGVREEVSFQKLDVLIRSAYKAVHLRENEDYVVKPVEHGFEIVIVDKRNTGRLAEKSRWHHGLHQFLEVRHHLPVKQENLLISSLCHPVFFCHYEKIYGLTGTIGTMTERAEIQQIYRVDTFEVPPHRGNQRRELPAIVCHTILEYEKALIDDITGMIAAGRPTLILLESIEQSEKIFALCIRHSIDCQLLNARQAEDESFVVSKAGISGSVTIATNTAGRGTDIVLSPTSVARGGLHVIYGFMPANDRVGMQGFGRAGRQGQPGSTRLVILLEKSTFEAFEAYGFKSSDLDYIEYSLLLELRDRRIERESSIRRFRAQIEAINHKYLQRFVSQFSSWQKVSYRKFPRSVIQEKEAFLQKVFSIHFYDKLDELLDAQCAVALDHPLILAKYATAIESLYEGSKPFWEKVFTEDGR